MKPQIMAILIGLSCVISACGKDDSNSAGGGSKGLFSVWTRDDNKVIFDWSKVSFGTSPAVFSFTGGECSATMTFAGAEDKGNIAIGSSTYVGTGTDPGCASINGTATFTKNSNTLTICGVSSGICHDYK